MEKIWQFTKEYVRGLYELAKNIIEHSTTKQGMITLRAYSGQPQLDTDLADSMLGTFFLSYDQSGNSTQCRYSAPFSPTKNGSEQNDIVDEFSILSGMIGLGIGSIHKFHCLLQNPNALRPLSNEFVSRINEAMNDFVWM